MNHFMKSLLQTFSHHLLDNIAKNLIPLILLIQVILMLVRLPVAGKMQFSLSTAIYLLYSVYIETAFQWFPEWVSSLPINIYLGMQGLITRFCTSKMLKCLGHFL